MFVMDSSLGCTLECPFHFHFPRMHTWAPFFTVDFCGYVFLRWYYSKEDWTFRAWHHLQWTYWPPPTGCAESVWEHILELRLSWRWDISLFFHQYISPIYFTNIYFTIIFPWYILLLQGHDVVIQCRDEGRMRRDVYWSREGGMPLPQTATMVNFAHLTPSSVFFIFQIFHNVSPCLELQPWWAI